MRRPCSSEKGRWMRTVANDTCGESVEHEFLLRGVGDDGTEE